MPFDSNDSDASEQRYTPEPKVSISIIEEYEFPIGTRVKITKINTAKLKIDSQLEGYVWGYINTPLESDPECYTIFSERNSESGSEHDWIPIPTLYIPLLDISVRGDECVWDVLG